MILWLREGVKQESAESLHWTELGLFNTWMSDWWNLVVTSVTGVSWKDYAKNHNAWWTDVSRGEPWYQLDVSVDFSRE